MIKWWSHERNEKKTENNEEEKYWMKCKILRNNN